MKFLAAIGLLLWLATSLRAQMQSQTPQPQPQDSGPQWESFDDWLNDTFDPDVLRALSQLDAQKVGRILFQLQQAMAGTNIYQLGELRDAARQAIPLLQKYDETEPYGDWLQARMDYLEAAGELQREAKAASNQPAAAPSQKMERRVWARTLERRPWPPQARNFVPQLKSVFVSERTPPELVWVAEVESSFQPHARSPSGAAGMFQLLPQTARDEQLSLWPWDERLQPQKSARAAARYLRALHEHYGDWELALAAYDAGEGRVDKLLKRENAHSFEAIARLLPAETQMYVPRVEATVRKREGRRLQDLRTPEK